MEKFWHMFSPIQKVSKHLAKSSINIWAFFCFLQCNPHRLFFKGTSPCRPSLTCTSGGAVVSASRRQSMERLASPSTLQQRAAVLASTQDVMFCEKTHNKLNLIAFPLFFFIFLSMLRSVPKIEKLLKKKKQIF